MKTLFLLIVSIPLHLIIASGQNTDIELNFTAIDNDYYIQCDSIKVMNRTQGGDTMLYWPDTTLILDYHVGVSMIESNKVFQVFQNYPNPVIDNTTISLSIPENGHVNIIVTDILGQETLKYNRIFNKGKHSFRFIPGSQNFYLFKAQYKGKSSSRKIMNISSHQNVECSLEYMGSKDIFSHLKGTKDVQNFSFNLGDELLSVGYNDTLQSGILEVPTISKTITFQFATNISCLDIPTVLYEGQIYNTIQIFNQCWLKENLNVGIMIPGSQDMEDNNTIEKYCYGNNSSNCDNYGGLYIWDEMMQYTVQQGAQGICPPGWHVPKDEEWKILEGSVDSYYGIGDQVWDIYGMRGYDAGKNLKTTTGWSGNGNGTDLFGFSGRPGGGYLYNTGNFYYIGQVNLYWSSTEGDNTSAWNRYFIYDNQKVDRDYGNNKGFGFSIRCLRNN